LLFLLTALLNGFSEGWGIDSWVRSGGNALYLILGVANIAVFDMQYKKEKLVSNPEHFQEVEILSGFNCTGYAAICFVKSLVTGLAIWGVGVMGE
jgi:hypothetical protein